MSHLESMDFFPGDYVSFQNPYKNHPEGVLHGVVTNRFHPNLALYKVLLDVSVVLPHFGMKEPGESVLTDLNVWSNNMKLVQNLDE